MKHTSWSRHVRAGALAFATCVIPPSASGAQEDPELLAVRMAGEAGGIADRSARAIAIVFEEDFESGMSEWTVSDLSAVGVEWGDWDCWSSSGSRSAGCAAAGSAAIGCTEPYPGLMKTWMVHGPFSLSFGEPYDWVECLFQYTVDAEFGFDRLVAAVSKDGVHFEGVEYQGAASGQGRLDLTNLRDEPNVWIGFQFTSDHAGGFPIGASVDDIVVRRDDPLVLPPPNALSYGWSVSSSSVDPLVNEGGVSPLGTVYLWYACDDVAYGPASGFVAWLYSPAVVSFSPVGGVLNKGTPTNLWLEFPGCQSAPFVVGEIEVVGTDPTPWLWVRSPWDSTAATFDCSGIPRPNKIKHFNFGLADTLCGTPYVTSVDDVGWGRIKALYRR